MPKRLNESERADDPRRGLASVSALLSDPSIEAMIGQHGRAVVTDAARTVLAGYRRTLGRDDPPPATSALVRDVSAAVLAQDRNGLRRVINATGVILHTGLGRAVLPQRAVDALASLNGCCNLQIDLDTGLRGKRDFSCEQLLTRLTRAEAAMVVNNNAAATYLILTALCKGREVVVSRGQLIEIGGSFRLPDCVHQSGATLVEVGTTNKTHLRDYELALSVNTGAILRVNPSNYRIIGFTEDVPIRDLVGLKRRQAVLVIDDLGCGALLDLRAFGLPREPTVQESVAAGADLVCFSGDKLIGGPQSGIIVGSRALIQQIKKHPLTRMLRVGKMTVLALERTLQLFLDPEGLVKNHPTLRMLALPAASLRQRASRMAKRLAGKSAKLQVRVAAAVSSTGGGSLPGFDLPTSVVALRSTELSADRLCRLLRLNEPPIIARIKDDEVLLDMRTLLEGDESAAHG